MGAQFVFIHGGLHSGRCWDDTIAALGDLSPDVTTLAVDLPGRGRVRADLAALTIDDCATAVLQQINAHRGGTGGDDLVLVGHSLGGIVLCAVAARLWHDPTVSALRVVFVACCVPAPGQSVIDTLPAQLRPIVRRLARRSPVIQRPPRALTRYAFGNHANRAQRAAIAGHMVPESSALISEKLTASVPVSLRRSWILTERDRALPPRRQRVFIDNIGGVDETVGLDAGHEVMITHPHQLAAALIQLTHRRGDAASGNELS